MRLELAAAPMLRRAAPSSSSVAAADGGSVLGDGAERRVAVATAPAAAPGARPETFDSLIGATLAGRYEIVRRIGEGGMGAVYEARHTVIGKRVAVKVLLEKFLTKSDFVARLLQEARLASSIGHENIVDVTDFGTTDDGRSFVVMEFLDGEALAQLVMREAPLPVERSLRIARQVASALGAAHAKGIYHRDVKPENVYLVRRGDADFVKVVDFGISKAVKQGGDDPARDLPAHAHGAAAGDAALHVARAGARRRGSRPPRRHLGARRHDVRVPHGRGAVPRQQLPRHHLAGADAHGGAAVAGAPRAGHPRRRRGGRHARHGEGSPAALSAMADLEHDLERLLAGDQNVGSPLVAAPATRRAPGRDRRLCAAGAWRSSARVVMVAGIALALRHPSDAHPGPDDGGAAGRRGRAAARGRAASAARHRREPLAAPPPASTARAAADRAAVARPRRDARRGASRRAAIASPTRAQPPTPKRRRAVGFRETRRPPVGRRARPIRIRSLTRVGFSLA